MARELKFDPDFKNDTKDAALYYEDQKPGLGGEFLIALSDGIKRLTETPLRWRPIRGKYRRCNVKKFPYVIIFSVTEKEIYIAALMHKRRHPDFWLDRIE